MFTRIRHAAWIAAAQIDMIQRLAQKYEFFLTLIVQTNFLTISEMVLEITGILWLVTGEKLRARQFDENVLRTHKGVS